jgi:dTDP-glucose pyrophosphorylase
VTDFLRSCLTETATLHAAIERIEDSPGKVALVVDPDRHLLGTVTDGDIRRALLAGIGMDAPVSKIMNRSPRVALITEQKEALLERMRQQRVRQLPLVDEQGRLQGLETLTDLLVKTRHDNWVVLMAGGEGRRLRPLTVDVPKPMLPVGPKPILETIIDNFISAGFHKFFLSVNYKADLVESHFGDGSNRGVEIEYLREGRSLGTAGSLNLLPERPTEPLFVMNGDILTKVDFNHILDFHRDSHAAATMCVRDYGFELPYGVVEIEGDRLASIIEKPTIRHFVNAGIYVLEPDTLDHMTQDMELTMPQLFASLMAQERNCSVCPISEYWVDIGHKDDFERANNEFSAIFDD